MKTNTAKKTEQQFPTTRLIALDKLRIDPGYQRPCETNRVDRMGKTYDPNLCTPLVVNEREDGTFAVVDGQHRLATLREMGVTKTECFVLHVDREEEARLFVKHQTERRRVTTPDRHRAQVYAGEPTAMLLEDIVRSLGLKIVSGRSEVGCISAVAGLYRVYTHGALRGDAERHVRDVLLVLKGAWGTSEIAYASPFLTSLSVIVYTYKTSPHELIERLAKVDPRECLTAIRSVRSSTAHASRGGVLVMLERLNKGRRGGRFDSSVVLAALDDMKVRSQTEFRGRAAGNLVTARSSGDKRR